MAQAPAFSDFQGQFQSFFQDLSPSKRISLFVVVLGVLIALGSMVYFSGRTTYSPLVSGISQKDTALVAKRLDESQIPYIIASGGNGILVDSTLIDQARLDIADSGLMSGGIVGFELFDQKDISATEFQQNVQYRRAVEGELARLVMKINSIDAAKVMLAIPKETLFVDDVRPPSASVHLSIKEGLLSPRRVKTIVNLIVGAVPGMIAENVKISDQFGNFYTGASADGMKSEQREKNFQYASNIERYYEKKLFQQLSKITGEKGVEINVAADINFSTEEVEENIIDPDGSSLLSEEVIDEKETGSRSIPVGVPGVTTNAPEIRAGASEVANVSDRSKRHKKTNFENSTKYVKRQNNAGEITRLSISILLDDRVKEQIADDGRPVAIKESWSREEIENITRIAKNAVGFNTARGDAIEVRNISFTPSTEEKTRQFELEKQVEREFWLSLLRYALVSILALLMIFLVVKPMAKKLMKGMEDLNLMAGFPTTVGALEGEELEIPEDHRSQGQIPPGSKILDIARESPTQTAAMIRLWLKEKR